MAQSNKIDVKGVTQNGTSFAFGAVNYISFVSSPGGNDPGTYGIPALISEERVKEEGLPARVLYVNPANIAALEATRTA